MCAQQIWEAVDELVAPMAGEDDALRAAVRDAQAAGLPDIGVTPLQGRLLELLARAIGAGRILELGTLGGYSTIWLARALAPGGRVVTLELEPDYARIARVNLERAGVGDAVEIRVGPALDSLHRLADEQPEPFDLAFLDADKRSYPDYLDAVLPLLRPGALLIADNVVRGGGVADPTDDEPHMAGARRLLELLAQDPRVDATTIQTVGAKGYDGFALALVV